LNRFRIGGAAADAEDAEDWPAVDHAGVNGASVAVARGPGSAGIDSPQAPQKRAPSFTACLHFGHTMAAPSDFPDAAGLRQGFGL
jgi:hypothetical protein